MLKHKAFIAILIAAASIATAAVKFQMDQDKPFTFTWKGYDDAWKKVDSLEEKGLPRSAQDVVEVILEHAHTDKNGPQQIKAVTYIAKYALETEDDGFTLAQDMYKKEIAASTSPVKNILSSMLAGLYLEYYGSEAYILEGRTSVQENTSDDPNTWDIKTLYKKILEQTDASVADRELLKSIRAEDYALILENTTSFSYSARPTLYDLLGHRAMDLYMALGDMQAGPTAQVLTNPVLFADNKSFAGYAFSFDNTAQDKYIEMMQQLTLVHINDAPADPGIYLLLDRLDYMHNNYSADGVDEKYLQALYQAEKTYAKDTSSTWFTYQIAEWYHTQAAQYNRLEGEAHKWDNKTAILMCDSAIAKFPNTSGAKNAAALKDAIQFPTLHASVEEVNIPDKPFRVSVRYTNTQKVYFKLVQVSDAELKEINDKNGQDYLKQITKLKPIRTWSENIPDDGDHNEHVVELKVDALTPGRYFLVSSSNEKFSIQHSETNVTFFDVSNIGYISTDRYAIDAAAGGKLYYAVNRTSGEAVADATVKISTMKWVGKEYKEVLLQTLTTDREGKFVVPTPTTTEYMSFWFKIGKGTDTAYSSGSDYISNYTSNQPKEILNTLFFTDRSIYRPGQTVYYKGIVYNISADKKTKTVVPAHTTQVIFYDVNSQKVGEAELTTNDYGSFNGSFTIPGGVLTGMMRIQNEESSIYFSVEEYKRPTFSVEMQALEGSYVLNDSVFAKGIATTYSGAPVAGAKVQYRVTRNVFVPYYYRYAKSFPAYTDGVDIISGTSTTDAEGNFTIPFIALPGDGKDALQEYTYTVRADITDISGETRSGARSVSIGKKSMQMYADMDETLSGDSNVVITVHTENLNGVHVPVAGALTIYGLQGPGHILRSRRWEEPDKFIMTKTEYTSFFPNDIYAHENDISTWASKGVAAALTFNTADIDKLELPTEGLQNGMYRFVFSARDKNGEEISAEYFIEIKDGKGVSDVAKALTLGLDKTVYHPGENAILQVGSSIPGANVLFAVSKESNKRSYERFAIPIEHNKRNIYTSIDMEIDVTENDRGGFYVSACLFYLNDFYTENEFVQVPWDNKQLHVSLETHRDKLSPGSKETWKVTISGPQGEKVAAEMLASMYDASLDALTSHIWNDVSWPGASGSVYMIGNGQGTRQSYYSGNFNDRPGYIYRYYHDINSFGLHFYGRNGYYDGMVLEEVAIKSGKREQENRNADADGENVTKFVTMKAVEDFVDEKLVNTGVEGNNTMGQKQYRPGRT
ncbi:MAG: MG2 domain-containing protein [Chitinophagales bacterium]